MSTTFSSLFRSTLRAFVVFSLAALPVVAQYENGGVVGTIKDPTGAPIAHAAVTVTNTATAANTQAETNDAGEYDVPQLRAGLYKISAKAPGFADAVANNITVSVGNRQRIDLTLAVGTETTSVEVSGVALQIEADQSQRDQVITQYESASLPLVTRNYSDFLGLVTGVRQAPTAATTTSINSLVRAGAYNVNGQRSVFNNFLLDGMDNNAYGESNQGFDNQIIAIPPDSVSQFSVVTNNESAEYGRSSGATINVASASGSNQFHGIVYEFLRNTDLNAAGFIKPNIVSNTGTVTPFIKPTFNRNQFGMNFGGPILRDKLFFFIDYEGFRQVLKPLTVLTLPTQNQLNGILTVPVKDPQTGVVYAAGRAIPAAAINPLSAQIVNAFKSVGGLPAAGATAGGLATNDYAAEVPFTDNSDKGDLRLDFQESQATSWFLRVSDRKEDGVNFPSIPLPLDGQTNGNIRVLDQQVALGYTHLFGANKVLDARFGISRTKAGKYTLSIGNTAFAIPGLPSNPIVAGGLPSIGITNFTGFGRQSTNPQWQNPALIDPKVNYTWVKGNHSLKFGAEYEHVWMAVNDNNPLYGSFTFGGGFSGGTTADNYWADFLFGDTSAYSLANYFPVHLRQTLLSGYGQDDWRVSPQLTLNLGVRWEYGSPYSELGNNISNFDPITQTLLTITPGAAAVAGAVTPVTPSGSVYGKTLVHPDLNDFAPRIGFAYAASAKTALRGGFGTSYVHYTRAGSGDILAINGPQAQFAAVTQTGTAAPTTANHCAAGAAATTCYVTIDQGFPTNVAAFNKVTDNITWVPANTRDSYVENFYLSVQQQLAKNILFDVAYVGNHGLKLQGLLNGNQKNPAVGFARPFGNWPSDITEALNDFSSNYNALQVRYEQRMQGGLTLLNSFTWEHSIDDLSASLEGNTPSPQNAYNLAGDYAQSDYNLPIINVTSLIYELPLGHGRRFLRDTNGLVDNVLGGWQVSLVNTAQAGTPFNITYSPNAATAVSQQISATYRGANEYRPYIVPGQKVTQGRGNRAANTGYVNYVNLNAFRLQPTRDGAGNLLSPFGTASRNPGRSPAFYESDLDLNKRFNLPVESLKLEFRAELYNLFTHTNLYLPGTITGTLGTTTQTFGAGASVPLAAITGGVPTGGGQVTSTFEPRIAQFALKLIY